MMPYNKFDLEVRAKKDDKKTGEILVYSVISSDGSWMSGNDDVTPKKFKSELDQLGNINKLNIYINSGGGDPFAANAILSILERHPAYKTSYVDGLAASAASIIFMAGNKRVIPKNGTLMIHKPWSFVLGNADEMRRQADDLDKVEKSLNLVYREKTGLSEQRITVLLRAETWMTGEEAVEMGFADELAESKQMAASINNQILKINGLTVDLSGFQRPVTNWGKGFDQSALDDYERVKQMRRARELNTQIEQLNRRCEARKYK